MSKLLDALSNYLAHRKGLLPLAGAFLVLCNLTLRWAAPQSWLAGNDLLLHLGILLAIFGFLLARAL